MEVSEHSLPHSQTENTWFLYQSNKQLVCILDRPGEGIPESQFCSSGRHVDVRNHSVITRSFTLEIEIHIVYLFFM